MVGAWGKGHLGVNFLRGSMFAERMGGGWRWSRLVQSVLNRESTAVLTHTMLICSFMPFSVKMLPVGYTFFRWYVYALVHITLFDGFLHVSMHF